MKDLYHRFWTISGREARSKRFDCQDCSGRVKGSRIRVKEDIETYGLAGFVRKDVY